MKSIFITFEGTEGSGKSTLIRALKPLIESSLEFSSFEVILTREPGGTAVAEKIREIILSTPMKKETELLLYEAARSEHFQEVLLPALQKNKIILCDRFTDSSLAYQGHARGIPLKEVQWLNDFATQKNKPDLTVFLDLNPQVGLSRATDQNRFEKEGLSFQKKVRQGFLKAKALNKKRWLHISVKQQTPEELAANIHLEMTKRFKIRKPAKKLTKKATKR